LSFAADAERAVGIECYATNGPRCHARIRSTPEDFTVEERISFDAISVEMKEGYFPLYRVEKRAIDTMHMAKEIGFVLKSRVSYGGLKDSRAVAVQYVTPTSLKSSRPAEIVRERFNARLVGYLPRPLSRSSVLGNAFHIVLRDCCTEIENRIDGAFEAAGKKRIPNYFGLQRFGAIRPGTHNVGRAMVKRDFEGAVRLLLGPGKSLDLQASKTEGTKPATESFRRGQDVERKVAKEIGAHPGEWIRALRAVPVRLRRLYVQAYQSFIFNKTLSGALTEGEDISRCQKGDNWAEVSRDGLIASYPRSVNDIPSNSAVPLVQVVGYAYRNYSSRFDKHVEQALQSEGVKPSQFYLQEMQEVSSEGGFRRTHLVAIETSRNVEGKSATVNFTLARGQYATILLREIMKPEDPAGSGLV
jgi:tRNA pseudouridine13 synthase